MNKIVSFFVALSISLSIASPSHAFFFKSKAEKAAEAAAMVVFHDVVDAKCSALPGKKGFGEEKVINEKAACHIKKFKANKGELQGVMGNWFFIVVKADNGYADLVTMPIKAFQKDKEGAKDALKEMIKASVIKAAVYKG